MKLFHLLPILLLSSVAFSADTPGPQPASANTAATTPTAQASPAITRESKPTGPARAVTPSTPVLTIDGVCPAGSSKRHECKTAITRAEFEKLITVLPSERAGQRAPMSPMAKRQFATQYARQLVLAAEAEKQNLQNTPAGRELLEYARSQALAQMVAYQIKNSTQPTAEEVKSFYDANRDRYAELTLERVFIPLHQLPDGKTSEAEMKALANDLRQRAASVTEFSGLQAEANEKAEIKNPPQPRIVLPASAIPGSQQAVLQLKVGELSEVIQDASGFYFYKLTEKRPLPFEGAATEIQESLAELKMQRQMEKLLSANKPVLNPQYFQQNTPARRGSRKTVTIAPQRPYRPAPTVTTTSSN